MDPISQRPPRTDPRCEPPPSGERHDVALEPGQAWLLKGILGEADEVVVPGLLLDDLGGCSSVEATMDLGTYFQMLAMVSVEEARMLAARAAPSPERTRPEANVWSVEGVLAKQRLAITGIGALDRVLVDAYGTHCVATLLQSQIVPGAKSWR